MQTCFSATALRWQASKGIKTPRDSRCLRSSFCRKLNISLMGWPCVIFLSSCHRISRLCLRHPREA
ncbi:rCG63016 [Rattus norvegicus]|uniref:RCG63016 n=1 Tax=Rattus norvegicus TaxID=10116 RepID=A6IS40_RAT|nr:rCG63016 [Rattus norvegicus]